MQLGPSNQVTELLVRWRRGNRAALDSLLPLVYSERRRIANHYLQQQSRVVESKFFGGLSIDDTAEVLGISASTVKRDGITAKAWLFRELDRSAAR